MNRVLAVLICLIASAFAKADNMPVYNPSEEELSDHRLLVYNYARDYIIKTFNLSIIEESEFNPVRFNSIGVWGDFEARLKELGADRFEVQGWVIAEGHYGKRVVWYVVVELPIEHPEAWKYRWVNREYKNEPKFTSWKFGPYWSVPYEAEYSEDFLTAIYKRRQE